MIIFIKYVSNKCLKKLVYKNVLNVQRLSMENRAVGRSLS